MPPDPSKPSDGGQPGQDRPDQQSADQAKNSLKHEVTEETSAKDATQSKTDREPLLGKRKLAETDEQPGQVGNESGAKKQRTDV